MIQAFRELFLRSRISTIIFTVAVGGILDTFFFLIEHEPVNPNELILSFVVSVLLGIFLHEFFKAQEVVKEKKKLKV